MNPDENAVRALARLTEALSEEILDASDAEFAGIFPGRSGRVAADAWRQMVRRVGAAANGAEPPPPLRSPEIAPDREEDTP